MRRGLLSILLLALACAPPAASAAVATEPWPPATGPGQLFVHYGEEHFNDDDGSTLFPKVVQESGRYRPKLVTTSGDKGNDGTVDQLTSWKTIMSAYDPLGVPYLAGIGNHDRQTPPGVPPGTAGLLTPGVQGSLTNYRQVFADRPFPFGDAPNYEGIGPARSAADSAGASSHYFADVGKVRWIFLDNSCWGIADCDGAQSPPFPDEQGNTSQLGFLERNAAAARDAGMTAFVVMHMPTRDPRDQSYIDPTTFTHVMGKNNPAASGTPDNERFEAVAERTGVDGVFLGHIKGQFLYRGRGDVPYYIDGGAGGELYTEGPVGTDHGYWHGFRLVRVNGGEVTTDTVPIFVPGGIRIEGADSVRPAKRSLYTAFGRQPVINDPAKVEALELRDPDPVRPVEGGGMGAVGGFVRDGGWAFVPVIALMLGGLLLTPTAMPRPRRRAVLMACTAAGACVVGTASISLAQQSEPTTTPLESLPEPARIFATTDPLVLAPVASGTDDPRRDPRTQTEDGLFEGRCPGTAGVSVTSGFETTTRSVKVPSRPDQRIVRSARVAKVRALRAPKRRTVARIKLVQPAVVRVLVRRRGRTVRTLRQACVQPGSRALRVAWNGRVMRKGRLRAARPGRYRIDLLVRSDRKPVKRSRTVRVLRKRG